MAIWNKKSEANTVKSGKLIVIEGTDTTERNAQIQLLAKTLASYDYDGMIFDFPQYSKTSEEMLKKYSDGQYGNLGPEATSILYAIDRFDASSEIRKHLLEEGKFILTNRYVPSNGAYQGSKIIDRNDRVKFYKWLDNLEYDTFKIPKPDLTIILHKQKEDNDTEKAYVEIANLFPNTKLIECETEDGQALNHQEIHAKIWELIRRMVLKNNSF